MTDKQVEAVAFAIARSDHPCTSMAHEIMQRPDYAEGHKGDASYLLPAGRYRQYARAALEAAGCADQVKELTARLTDRERERAAMSEAYREKSEHLLDEVLRSNTAEVALEEARKVMTELLQCQDGLPMSGIEAQRRADAARAWLKGDG